MTMENAVRAELPTIRIESGGAHHIAAGNTALLESKLFPALEVEKPVVDRVADLTVKLSLSICLTRSTVQ